MTHPTLSLNIPNARTPAASLCTGGQPSAQHIHEAKQQGVRTVINLRPPTEPCEFDEAALVTSLGMRYVNLPIAGPVDLTVANAQKLAAALAAAGDCATLVHCASSNRVGALFALKAHFLDGLSIEEAVAIGRDAGLTAMESAVRQILGA